MLLFEKCYQLSKILHSKSDEIPLNIFEHLNYAEQFLYQIHLTSLIKLAIKQAVSNRSRMVTLFIFEPSYESIDTIRNFCHWPPNQTLKRMQEIK